MSEKPIKSALPRPKTVSWSHFNDPVDKTPNGLHGRSRAWGDIDPSSRQTVIEELLTSAEKISLSRKDTALLLAITRVESGFNPDAAARTTSASGLGQFIEKTGSSFGITNATRFSLRENISAMFSYIGECAGYARRDLKGSQSSDPAPFIYAHYHDGPKLGLGGLKIAQAEVVPWRDRFELLLQQDDLSISAQAARINDSLANRP